MRNTDYSDSQNDDLNKEATRDARDDGEIVASIVRVLKEQKGVGVRQDFINKLPPLLSDYGLNDKDILNASHITAEGNKKNHFQSALDYTLTDMKNGKYGDDSKIEKVGEDGDVIWTIDNPATKDIAAIKEVASRTIRATTKEKNRTFVKETLFEYYKVQSPERKKSISAIGRDTIINHAINNKRSISQAIEDLIGS